MNCSSEIPNKKLFGGLIEVDFEASFVDDGNRNVQIGDIVHLFKEPLDSNYIVINRYFKIRDGKLAPFFMVQSLEGYCNEINKIKKVDIYEVTGDMISRMEYTDEYKFLLDVITKVDEIDKDLSKKYDVDSEEYRKMRILKVTNLLLDRQWCISVDKYFNKK